MNKLYILLSATLFISCLNNNQEKKVSDFLNNTLQKFDKSKFEFVSINTLDTISMADLYKYADYFDYPLGTNNNYIDYITVDTAAVDTIGVDESIGQTEINWNSESFSLALYNHIRYDGDDSKYVKEDEESPNEFLNTIVKSSYKDFKQKILLNKEFKTNFLRNTEEYKYFGGIFSKDSLFKFIEIENSKRKQIYGYTRLVKFRSNNVLSSINIIFDEKDNIIAYKFLY
jgi:hypothetical protein